MKQNLLFLLGFFILTAFSTDNTAPNVYFSLQKMNVVYAGVANPLEIKVPNRSIKISVAGGGSMIKKIGTNKYRITAAFPGQTAKLKVMDKEDNNILYEVNLRIKRIPNPVPILGFRPNYDNKYTVDVFKQLRSVAMILENFDFETRCSTRSYQMTRVQADGKRESVMNTGASFRGEAKALVAKATEGDIYIFDQIQSQCSSDKATRQHKTSLVAFIQ